MRIATPTQIAAIADAAGDRWRALVLTAAYSGLRWGELVGLCRDDVDTKEGSIFVRRQLVEVNGMLSYGPPKTAAGKRLVALPKFVVRELESHIERFSEPGGDGLIFPAAEGGPLRRSNFRRRVWVSATKAAGVRGLRFHDLRHTGATLAAASGAPLRALMYRMGHSSAAAAIRYQHVLDGQDIAIAEYLDRLIGRPARVDEDQVVPLAIAR
jgi:integrase